MITIAEITAKIEACEDYANYHKNAARQLEKAVKIIDAYNADGHGEVPHDVLDNAIKFHMDIVEQEKADITKLKKIKKKLEEVEAITL